MFLKFPVVLLALHNLGLVYTKDGHKIVLAVDPLGSSSDETVLWIPISSYGLMIAHPGSPTGSQGPPLIEASQEDDTTGSLFSPTLSSGGFPFVSWDEALVDLLEDMPWRRRSLTGSRDIAKRIGDVRLIRRADADGPDEVELAVTREPNLIYSSRSVKNNSGLDQRRMVRKATLTKRHKSHTKDAAKNLVNSFTKASKEIKDVMKGATIPTTITWYTGHDLLNPYCGRKSKWAPTDEALVIAVTQKWDKRPACGEFLEISIVANDGRRKGKSVIARVVDLCGGCKPGISHADLSKAAFTRLFNLDVGIVSGLAMRKVAPPKKWSNKLYGPRVL
ncbi:secreted protein [Melampsora americana]|nr:secreted protein [Melampsora americana]